MAVLTYTFQKLQQACQHASGGVATPATGSTWADVVNDALQWLATCYPWSWRNTALSLNLTLDQNYVSLPADFGELVTLRRNSTVNGALQVSLERLINFRTGIFPTGFTAGDYYYALSAAAQANVTSAGTFRLELYPTPAASETGGLLGIYRRIPPAMSGNTDLPDIPVPHHSLLHRL